MAKARSNNEDAMLRRLARSAKSVATRFREPPWNRQSPEWQAIDAELPEEHLARSISEGLDGDSRWGFAQAQSYAAIGFRGELLCGVIECIASAAPWSQRHSHIRPTAAIIALINIR